MQKFRLNVESTNDENEGPRASMKPRDSVRAVLAERRGQNVQIPNQPKTFKATLGVSKTFASCSTGSLQERSSNPQSSVLAPARPFQVLDENDPISTARLEVAKVQSRLEAPRVIVDAIVSDDDDEAEFVDEDKENALGQRKNAAPERTAHLLPIRPPLVPLACPEDLEMHSVSESPQLDASMASVVSVADNTDIEPYFSCSEYAKDIYLYMLDCEKRFRPKWNYMMKQNDITHSMRSVLVDWLCEVAEEYTLHTETYFLTVSYIDRFLSSMNVMRAKLQLVGTASMYIASKYEEIYPPEVSEFVYITDDTYTRAQVLRMEQLVLKVLGFDLSAPTAYDFLMRIVQQFGASTRCQHLAQYLCELSLLEADKYLNFLPSMIAASALAIANHTLGRIPWTAELEILTNYSSSDLKECVMALYGTFLKAPSYPQQAIREKYKSSKFSQVALLTPLPAPPF